MRKGLKKSGKVPKITEEQYAAYIASLKTGETLSVGDTSANAASEKKKE